nr:hypothetical protein [Tanacetum cinerariifolium]
LALAEVDKTTVGSLTADGATDTTGVGSGCANNDGLACDKKSNIGTCSSWLNPMKAVGVKARLMKYIRGNQLSVAPSAVRLPTVVLSTSARAKAREVKKAKSKKLSCAESARRGNTIAKKISFADSALTSTSGDKGAPVPPQQDIDANPNCFGNTIYNVK